jgi:protein-arginine kinase activator protein McsA
MGKVKELEFKTRDEFDQYIKDKGKELSIAIVDGIIKNFNKNKKHVHVVSIFIEEEDNVYDLTVDREMFLGTLEQNLDTLLEHELYEKCAQVKELIDKLKKQKDEK